jgi:hypothetical protein
MPPVDGSMYAEASGASTRTHHAASPTAVRKMRRSIVFIDGEPGTASMVKAV